MLMLILAQAVFFDIDRYAAPSDLPHMMPSAAAFSQFAGALGIAETDTIVVYDTSGLFSAARVWWMFKTIWRAIGFCAGWGLAQMAIEGASN